ncbi:Rib/alpha-like domain-containing protein, partial [Streptococcus mitis]|uniref:Rib/alpha-like domain-containing protein n=1 Tax=Streptococcus mitis TaxID=28037 RepID=UPI002240FB25
AEANKKAEEDRKRLSKISASMGEYLAKSIGLPNMDSAVTKVNAAVTAIEEALKNPNADLTAVIKQAKAAEASIANAVLRAHNGKRSVLNGRRMERGVSFREVAPENANKNFTKNTVAYVVSETDSKTVANGYKEGTYLYATQGRQANTRPPEKANVPTRVEVRTIRSQVYMSSQRHGTTTEWEVTFNEAGEQHDNPFFYFTVPKGHTITHMEVFKKDSANANWQSLASSNSNNAFLEIDKGNGNYRPAIGNAWNNQGGSYYDNVAGVGPSGVGRGSLTSLRDFAFNNEEVFYQTDKISETVKQAGDFAFNTVENATANIYALHPKGSLQRGGYKIRYTTTSPANTKDFYMAGFRSLENSRHKNYLQMNGSNERYVLNLKQGVQTTFLKHGRLNALTDPTKLNKIADSYDRLTGRTEPVPPLAPGKSITYSIEGKNEGSTTIQYLANTKHLPFSRGIGELKVSIPNMGTRTLPFRIVTQSDVYEPVINKTVTAAAVSKGQVINPVSTIQKIDDKSNSISGFVKPDDMDDYNQQINGGPSTANVLPNTTAGTDNNLSRLNVKNVEWVGGSEIGSGIGEKMAVKAIVNGKEVYLPVPEDMDISRLGSPLSDQDKQAILAHNDLQGNATITGTKVGLTKQLKTIYKDDEGGDSVDVSEVFFENVAKARATAPRVDPKSDGSVVVSPSADNDKVNISYTPTNASTPTQITIKKSGTTWESTVPLPAGVTLDKSNGNVTISEEAVKDKTNVTATSYNFNSDGATTSAAAKAPYQAKSERFYAVKGENSSQLNPRDFVVDGDGRALPEGISVKWKDSTLDLSTPGQKTATLLVTKGSETKEVEYKYTVYPKVETKTSNGLTGEFEILKGYNHIGGHTQLYTNLDDPAFPSGTNWSYRYNTEQGVTETTTNKPTFSAIWKNDTLGKKTYTVKATYGVSRFGTITPENVALSSEVSFNYTVLEYTAKQVFETTVGDTTPLASIIANAKEAVKPVDGSPEALAPTGFEWDTNQTPDAATVANPGYVTRNVKMTLRDSSGRERAVTIPVTIKVRPNPPQISADQVTNTGGLSNKGITVTNALPNAQVTLTINGKQFSPKTADSSGRVTFAANELADSNGLLPTGNVTVKQSKAFDNPVTGRSEILTSDDSTPAEITKETEKPQATDAVVKVKNADNTWSDAPKTMVDGIPVYTFYSGDSLEFTAKFKDNSGVIQNTEIRNGGPGKPAVSLLYNNTWGTETVNKVTTKTTATANQPATTTATAEINSTLSYASGNKVTRSINAEDFSGNRSDGTTFGLKQGELKDRLGEVTVPSITVGDISNLTPSDKNAIKAAVEKAYPQDKHRISSYTQQSNGSMLITYKDGTTRTVIPKLDYGVEAASNVFYTYVGEGDTIRPKDVIKAVNGGTIPSDADVTWEQAPDVTNSGNNKQAVVKVTYRDGTVKRVPVTYSTMSTYEAKEPIYDWAGEAPSYGRDRAPYLKQRGNDKILSGTDGAWYDANGNVVGNTSPIPEKNVAGTHEYRLKVTYPKGRFDDSTTMLSKDVTVRQIVVDPVKKADLTYVQGETNVASAENVLKNNTKQTLANGTPNEAFPEGTKFEWVGGAPSTTTSGIVEKKVKVTLPPDANGTRISKEVPVNVTVKPQAPQISDDQLTEKGGLPNQSITVTNVTPGATVTLTIGDKTFTKVAGPNETRLTFTPKDLEKAYNANNGLLPTGSVTVKQALPNPTASQTNPLESDTTVKEQGITKETEAPEPTFDLYIQNDKTKQWEKQSIQDNVRPGARGYEIFAGDKIKIVISGKDNSGKIKTLKLHDGTSDIDRIFQKNYSSDDSAPGFKDTPTEASTTNPAIREYTATYDENKQYADGNRWNRGVKAVDLSDNEARTLTVVAQGKLSKKFPGKVPATVQVTNATTPSADDKKKILEAVKGSNPQEANRISRYEFKNGGAVSNGKVTVVITYKDGTSNEVEVPVSDSDHKSEQASRSASESASTSASQSASTSASQSASTSASQSASTSASQSASTSASQSASTSASQSASTSASQSASTSASQSASTSASQSASTSASQSASTSASQSASTSASQSASTSASQSASTSASQSASTSASQSASTSASQSASTSASQSASTSASQSASTSASQSASTSASQSASTSASQSASTSASQSASTSASQSASTSASQSASTSASQSASTSASQSASTSASQSASTSASQSASTSASQSASTSASQSASTSASQSASTSASQSASTSASQSASTSASQSASTSASQSASTSASQSASTSASQSASTSASQSASTSASQSASTSASQSASTSASQSASTSASQSASTSASQSASTSASQSASTSASQSASTSASQSASTSASQSASTSASQSASTSASQSASTSASQSASTSASQSASTSASQSASTSASQSASTSASQSASTSASQSASTSASQSASTSASQSASTSASQSASTSASQSASTSASQSASTSASQSASTSASQSASTSASQSASTSASQSASTSASQSASTSASQSASTSASQSASTSASQSASTSASQSASTSASQSASTSASQSASTSASQSASTSASQSASTSASQSASTSASQSASTSASQSASTSASQSASTSASQSASTSASQSASTSASQSASTSASQSASTSASQSASTSASQSASTSASESASTSASQSASTSASESASTSASASASTSASESAST